MGEEVSDVGVVGRSKPVSVQDLAGLRSDKEPKLGLTSVVVIGGVAAVEGAIWIIVLVIPHLGRLTKILDRNELRGIENHNRVFSSGLLAPPSLERCKLSKVDFRLLLNVQ